MFFAHVLFYLGFEASNLFLVVHVWFWAVFRAFFFRICISGGPLRFITSGCPHIWLVSCCGGCPPSYHHKGSCDVEVQVCVLLFFVLSLRAFSWWRVPTVFVWPCRIGSTSPTMCLLRCGRKWHATKKTKNVTFPSSAVVRALVPSAAHLWWEYSSWPFVCRSTAIHI